MRKTSQDITGDNTSITSGMESEIKKSGPSILKSTKNSIKRKVQTFSTDSDDTANEPLLHKSKEKNEFEKQSAKFLLSKTKTDFGSEKDNDKDKLLADDKITKPSISDITGITDASGSDVKDQKQNINQSLSTVTIHNHMNTNVFNSPGGFQNTMVSKSQILVEVDTSKPSGYTPSPLIFTTAKIHTDGKMNQMEPVQITPVPILSTIEGGVVKTEIKVKQFDKKKDIALKSPESRLTDSNTPEKYDSHVTSNENIVNGSMKRYEDKNNDSKVKISTQLYSLAAEIPNASKITSVESMRIKNGEPSVPSKNNKGAKTAKNPISIHELQQASNSYSISDSTKIDFTKPASTHVSSEIDKSYKDINKIVHSEPNQDSGKKTECKKMNSKVASCQPSGSSSNNTGINSRFTFEEDKKITNVDTNTRKNKSGNSQESKIATGKLKSPDDEWSLNITKPLSTVKPSTDSINDSKDNTKNSPDNLVAIITNSGTFKPLAKEQASNKATNVSIAKNSSALSSKDTVDSAMSPKYSSFKAETLMNLIPNSTKSSEIQSMATSSLTKSNTQCDTTIKETSPQSKPINSKPSNLSSVSNASKSTKSTVVISASISPQINKVPNSITAKATPTTINKNSANAITTTSSSAVENSKLSTSISKILVTTGGVSKLKSNNVATIVSSISKISTTPSSTKSTSPSSSSSITTKSTPIAKLLTSPSTVKTISSVPTIKSAVVGTVHHDKISTKCISTPVKPMSTRSNNTPPVSSIAKKPLAAKGTSTVTVTPSAKVVATTSTKPATKSFTQSDVNPSEDNKDRIKVQEPNKN